MVVVNDGNGELYGELKLVVSACEANVMYSVETRFDRDSGREAPCTRVDGCKRSLMPRRRPRGAQLPRIRAAASASFGPALQRLNASHGGNFLIPPLRLSRLLM